MHVTFRRPLCACLLLLLCVARLSVADEPDAAQAVKTLILPGESFVVEGRPAFVLLPAAEKQRTPQPWIMYAPTSSSFWLQASLWRALTSAKPMAVRRPTGQCETVSPLDTTDLGASLSLKRAEVRARLSPKSDLAPGSRPL